MSNAATDPSDDNDVLNALKRQIDKARTPEFMERLEVSIAKHKHILDRLSDE